MPLPVLAVFVRLRGYFIAGITAGAVKCGRGARQAA